MPNQTNTPDTTPRQQDDPNTVETAKQTKLDSIANSLATRAVKRQQGYDQDHNIFTK
jgi:hypothetical protein